MFDFSSLTQHRYVPSIPDHIPPKKVPGLHSPSLPESVDYDSHKKDKVFKYSKKTVETNQISSSSLFSRSNHMRLNFVQRYNSDSSSKITILQELFASSFCVNYNIKQSSTSHNLQFMIAIKETKSII